MEKLACSSFVRATTRRCTSSDTRVMSPSPKAILSRSFRTSLARNHAAESRDADSFDVVIVGGGMVGSAMACALGSSFASSEMKVALIESAPRPRSQTGLPPVPDIRVSAISPASARLFKASGVWDRIANKRVAPYDSMKVWDGVSNGHIEFHSSDVRAKELGWMIENNIMSGCLQERLAQNLSNVQVLYSTAVKKIEFPNEDAWPIVTITTAEKAGTPASGKRTIRARLLIGADGYSSAVRQAAGIPTIAFPYHQKGVVATVEIDAPTTTAWQRFLPEGPVALLPLQNSMASIVWSTNESQADHLAATLSPERFVESLQNAFEAPIRVTGPFADVFRTLSAAKQPPTPPRVTKLLSKRGAFPLRFMHATKYTKPRVALIGDAAHTIHPLAGQGVNLGYADVTVLTNTIAEALENGQDIGDASVLAKYNRNRIIWNTTMMQGVDTLKRLFGATLPPIVALRSIGLTVAGLIPAVRAQFASAATGENLDTSRIGASCIGV